MAVFRNRRAGRVESLNDYKAFGDDVDFNHSEPNVVTSLFDATGIQGNLGEMHWPVIDIDFSAHLEPSSTEGHFHLYLDRFVTQEQLFKLLDVLEECSLVEAGYVEAAKIRGYTSVRLPGVKKEPQPDRLAIGIGNAAPVQGEIF